VPVIGTMYCTYIYRVLGFGLRTEWGQVSFSCVAGLVCENAN